MRSAAEDVLSDCCKKQVGKVDNTGTFAYTRDGDEVDDAVLADGAAVYNYGDNGNSLISENRGGASKYYHSDALGSTGALTNSSGTTTDTHVTDAFGMTVTGSGSTPTPFGFVGQGGYQSDSDTGLMLCGHRYFDSSTGRFLSRDPVQSGYNWYTYCENASVNFCDPTGHRSWKNLLGNIVIGAGIGIIVAITAPVSIPAAIIGGAIAGAGIAANNYYYDNPNIETWSNSDLEASMLQGAVVGGATAGIVKGGSALLKSVLPAQPQTVWQYLIPGGSVSGPYNSSNL